MKINYNSIVTFLAIIALILPVLSTRFAFLYILFLLIVISLMSINKRYLSISKSQLIVLSSVLLYSTISLLVYLINQVEPIHYIFYVGLPLLYLFVGLSGFIRFNSFMISSLIFLLLVAIFLFVFRDLQNNLTYDVTQLRILSRGSEVTVEPGLFDAFFLQNNTTMSVYFLTICAICLILYNQKGYRFFIYTFMVVSFLIFLLNTRSAYIALTLIVFIQFIYVQKSTSRKTFNILATLIFLFVFIFLFVQMYQDYFVGQLGRLTEEGLERSLERRYQLYWIVAWDMFQRNIFGHGHRLFFEMNEGSVHNDYLGQLVSVGVFASFFYFLFLVVTLINSFRLMRVDHEKIQFASSLVFYSIVTYLILSLTEQIVFSAKEWIYLKYLFIGIFYHEYFQYKLEIKELEV